MIITALTAENFRKYERLHLGNLPERGLLAVTGGNESGKSSIGDAIQFGLFGRTDQLAPEEATKLIRWGTKQTTVSLKLRHREHEYRLIRSINQAGDTVATLFSTEEGLTLADTPEAVERQLQLLLGYNYKAFVQAFYWSQQSTRVQQGDSDNLRALAGLREHAQLRDQLQSENRERLQTIADMELQLQTNQSALENLHIDDTRLPQLETVGAALEERQQHFLQLAQKVDKEAEVYPSNHERFHGLRQKFERIGFWTRLCLLIFIVTLLLGVAFLFAPGIGSTLLASMDASLRETIGRVSVRIASITALLSAILLIYGWYLEARRMPPLRRQAQSLSMALHEAFHLSNTPAVEQLESEAGQYLLQTQTDMPERSSDHPDIAVIPEWAKSAERYETYPSNISSIADAVNISMEQRNREFGKYLRFLYADVETEQLRLNQREQIQAGIDQQEEALEHIRRDRVVFDTAIGLLQRSGGNSIGRFNQLVRNRCTELLQNFTDGHYNALEIDEDFALKVMSPSKQDYLDFSEISAGTQRQIALALRIALANALAGSTQTRTQFLFLDEPLAFFDPERAASTLNSLQANSNGPVSQIWLTAQTLPANIHFAQVINCPQGSPTLEI